MKPNAGSKPLKNPRHEIYCVEVTAGLTKEDALHVSGAEWPMLMEPGERTTPTRSRVQRQILRRLDARIAVLDELVRGVKPAEHQEYLWRTARARAELEWFRLVVLNGGVEPSLDEDGQPQPPATAAQQYTPPQQEQ